MASAVRRLGAYLGLVEDEYYEEAVEETPARDVRAIRHDDRVAERSNTVRPIRSSRSDDVLDRQVTVLPTAAEAINRIVTLQPASFNDSQRVGEAFRAGSPVVMNLTALDRAQAQRVIDFASGLVFGLHGTIQRVTDKVFLLSPRNVDIEVDAAREAAVNAFFNHS